jgi:hypothetical protein
LHACVCACVRACVCNDLCVCAPQIEYASEAAKRSTLVAEAKAKAGYFSSWLGGWGGAVSTPAKIEYLLSVRRQGWHNGGGGGVGWRRCEAVGAPVCASVPWW